MPYIPTIFDDLRALIREAIPEVIPGGIWESTHINRVEWEKLNPPFCVIHIDHFPRNHDLNADGINYLPKVEIYVADTVKGPATTIIAYLEALRDVLINKPALTNGQIWDIGDYSWANSLAPNVFLAAKKSLVLAGMIEIEIAIGQYVIPD